MPKPNESKRPRSSTTADHNNVKRPRFEEDEETTGDGSTCLSASENEMDTVLIVKGHYDSDEEEIELARRQDDLATEARDGQFVLQTDLSTVDSIFVIGLAPRSWAEEVVQFASVECNKFLRNSECELSADESDPQKYGLVVLKDAETWRSPPHELVRAVAQRLKPGGIIEVHGLGEARFPRHKELDLVMKKAQEKTKSLFKRDLDQESTNWEQALQLDFREVDVSTVEIQLKRKELFPGTESWFDGAAWFSRYLEKSSTTLEDSTIQEQIREARKVLGKGIIWGTVTHFIVKGRLGPSKAEAM